MIIYYWSYHDDGIICPNHTKVDIHSINSFADQLIAIKFKCCIKIKRHTDMQMIINKTK